VRGRRFSIGTSGLTPLTPDIDDFINRIRTWTKIARTIKENYV